MSVLKYNNNGTWEGLNIDHASTADSCLYDANGDPIVSTYATKDELADVRVYNQSDTDTTLYGKGGVIRLRPNGYSSATGQTSINASGVLTIGNNVYHNAGEADPGEFYQYNGTNRGAIYISGSTGTYPCFNIRACNGSTYKASLQLDSNNGYAILGGDGVYIRPNGVGSTTGQLYMPTSGPAVLSGDLRRTAKTYAASRTASTGVTASNSKVCGITGIEAGVYLVTATIHIAMTSAGNAYINLYRSTSNTNKIVFDNHYVKAGSTWICTTTWVTCSASDNVSFYIEPSAACTTDTAYLEMIRIA